MIDSEVCLSSNSRKIDSSQQSASKKTDELRQELQKYEFSPSSSQLEEGNSHKLQGIEDLLQDEQDEDEPETDQLLKQAFCHSEICDTIVDFDWKHYTSVVDLSKMSEESIKKAEQFEREIMNSRSDNIHVQDERNDPSVHVTADDNTLYTSISRNGRISERTEIIKELLDDYSTKADTTQDSMRPGSAKSEQSVQMGGNNLKSKGKKLRLTNNTFEPQFSHFITNERFQINKLANKNTGFNLEERFLEKLKAKKDISSLEYAEEKLINQDCSWRSFLCDQKKDHILLFNNLMVKSGHTSSGSSIGSHLSNSFHQGHNINPNKLNSYFNQAAIAMSLNIQQSLNGSFTLGPQSSNLNLSQNNLNSSTTNLPSSSNNNNNGNNNINQVLSSSGNFSNILTGSTASTSTQQVVPQLFHFDQFQNPGSKPKNQQQLNSSTSYSKKRGKF